MVRITQTKENRDKVRSRELLTELYYQIERAYGRYGLPGLAIAMHAREQALIHEVDDLIERVDQTAGMVRVMLAFRIEQDGHAKNLGEAMSIADDRERVSQLYPELTTWAWADREAA